MILLQLACLCLPWRLRRWILNAAFGWHIHQTAKIGFSLLATLRLNMGPNSRIGHLNFARYLEEIALGGGATIGNKNWISGYPISSSDAFQGSDRFPSLQINDQAAITNSHRIDCTDRVVVGAFTTIAGWNTQIITHSIKITEARQRCAPIEIGSYCFIGTRCVILTGAKLSDYSVLSAGSVLSHVYQEPYGLYSGVPAKRQRNLDPNAAYFTRRAGPCY
ncbi:acyltransferase [Bradyrhizobium hipponense]|uniref:Acyltransferase n=2 Tax=Bradyrhizobium hipponense TaxID=2605638 RepID=A0A5S4YC26_9BRAD|nr:acyltransferase [Bradyrhizobium hipponense]